MKYPSIETIQSLCEPKLSSLDPAYRKQYESEIKDLKKWSLFLQTDKAQEILSLKGARKGSNKSGSVILWLLEASIVDPLQTGIKPVIQKFGKADPPDIDIDLHPSTRDAVKAYLVEQFGADKVCSVGTVGTYKTKKVIQDVARALGLDVKEAVEVTKNLEGEIGEGDEETKLDKASFEEICNAQPELRDYFARHEDVLTHAEILRNQATNYGTHAGGVIISNLELTERIPVFRDKEGRVVSAWAESGDFQELSSVGFIKFDVLGLNNLPIVDDCINLIKQNRGITLKRSEIPIDDRTSIKMGTNGELMGIFQFENPYTKKVADRVGVDCLGDIAAITSLIRPGPKDVGLDMEYAERKNGKPYDRNPMLEKALGETYGVLTYQEQIQKLAVEMAGMTPLKANALRKACSKKKLDLMAKLKEEFIQGSIEKSVKTGILTEAQVNDIWNLIESMAGYAFNKSHAVAYSALTTVEIWLRYHYFAEYMTALIQNADLKKEKFGQSIYDKYIKFAIDNGVNFHKPDINLSRAGFRLEGTDVYYALDHIKNVSSAAEPIVKFQPYSSLEDFYNRCLVTVGEKGQTRRPTTRVVESLIYAGAFDRFGKRDELFRKFYEMTDRVEKWALPRVPLCIRGFADIHVPSPCITETDVLYKAANQAVTGVGKAKRSKPKDHDAELFPIREIRVVREKKYIDLPNLDEKSLADQEEEMIGIRLSGNLMVEFREQIKDISGICGFTRLKFETDKVKIKVMGRITGIKDINFKSGNAGLRVYMSDGTKDINFLVFTSGAIAFRDKYQEGDIAVIPLKNFGKDSDDPTFRFFDDRGDGVVLKRI